MENETKKCKGCENLIKKSEKRGRPRDYCEKCRPSRARKAAPAATA